MIIPIPTSPSLFSKFLQGCKCLCVINCCSSDVEMVTEATQSPNWSDDSSSDSSVCRPSILVGNA